jgi:hypothetical protein
MRQKVKGSAEDLILVLYYVVDMFADICLCNTEENSKKDIL